jgi:hypothetical protein
MSNVFSYFIARTGYIQGDYDDDTADVKQVPFWKVVVVTSHVKNSQSAGSGGCILPPNYW